MLNTNNNIHTVRDLLSMDIYWRQRDDGNWRAQVFGRECVLLMNDYPQSLFTVSAVGESLALDDTPANWKLELPD